MKDFALSLPGFGEITPPSNVPVGSLFTTGAEIIRLGLTVFLIIIVLLAIFYILWGGIRYTFSRGDREKLQGAREKITYAIVGLIVAFFAFLIIGTTGQFFNVNLIGKIAIGPTPPACAGLGGECDVVSCCPGKGLICDFSLTCVLPTPTSTPAPTPGDTTRPTVLVTHSPPSPNDTNTVRFSIGVSDPAPSSGLQDGKTIIHIDEDGDKLFEFTHICPVGQASGCHVDRGPYPAGRTVTYWGEATDKAGNRDASDLPDPSFTVASSSTPIPTPTGTPTPTPPAPTPSCTGTPSLSLDKTIVPPGGSFTATVTGMSSGCNTIGAGFFIDGSPTGINCMLSASGTCSITLTAPTIELTYMYQAWVDRNLSTFQDAGEMSNTVPLTVLVDTSPPFITLLKVGGDVSPPYQTLFSSPIVEFTTNESAWCKFSMADDGYDIMSFNCESGESTRSHQCNTSGAIDFVTVGPKNLFLACRDAVFNRHTAADNYKVDVETISLGLNNVSGRVWVDAVVNGIYDWQLGEQAYCGATVEAYRDGSLVRNVITDSVGYYLLAGLEDGDYTISLSVPAGYTMSPGTSHGDTVDIFLNFSQAIDFGIIPNVPSPSFPGCIK